MSWVNCIGNRKPIESMYSKSPSLKDVRLHELNLHQDGPRMSIRFDLNEFPDIPPRKWVSNDFNCVQLILVLIDVRRLSIEGWSSNNIVDVALEVNAGEIVFTIQGKSTQIKGASSFAEIEKISGYRDELRQGGTQRS